MAVTLWQQFEYYYYYYYDGIKPTFGILTTLLYLCIIGAVIGFMTNLFEVLENTSSLSICAELKNCVNRNVSFNLNVFSRSAAG